MQAYWAARDAANVRIAAAAEAGLADLQPTDLDLTDGGNPGLLVTGDADHTPILILNALGQRERLWRWIVLHLRDRHRLLLWNPPGTYDGPSQPSGFETQVEGIIDALDHANVGRCHLVAWCTGAKFALRLHARAPGRFRSTTLLSGAYKNWSEDGAVDSDSELWDSEWEVRMERFVARVADEPRLAAQISMILREVATGSTLDPAAFSDARAFAEAVLRLVPRSVQPDLVGPFDSANSTLRYCRQLRDFWSHDLSPWVAHVSGPVLLISGSVDAVASLDLADRLGERLAAPSKHVILPGVGHHCMVERHEDVAALIAAHVSGQSARVAQ